VRAIDTNVLVFAEITSSPQHVRAREVLRELVEGATAWALPWPCVYEFLRVVTHPRVYHPPVPTDLALRDLRAVLGSPSLLLLSETPRHAEVMEAVVRGSGVSGNLIHDAHVVALCLEHGVTRILTGDRDFRRFDGIEVVDPFADG
jgi:toxin-antitoxin system PIN domain toxin